MYDKIVQLKLLSNDGKYYETDCANTQNMFQKLQNNEALLQGLPEKNLKKEVMKK